MGIMSGIGRAAHGILDQHHPQADIDGVEHRGEHADIGLRAGGSRANAGERSKTSLAPDSVIRITRPEFLRRIKATRGNRR